MKIHRRISVREITLRLTGFCGRCGFSLSSLRVRIYERGFMALAVLLTLGGGGAVFAQTLGPGSPAPPEKTVLAYAFAKASPLTVFDGPTLTGGHLEEFEFGEAYEVSEQTFQYLKLKLHNGKFGYVRSAHVTAIRSPRWLASTAGYNKSERAGIRLWESAVKLNEFLAGINTATSRWDYEEFFDRTPKFKLNLPIIETDTLDLLGGPRQVKIVSVMLPITREMYQAFEECRSGVDKRLGLHLAVDVSGSTKDFLEPVMNQFVKQLSRNAELQKRVDSIFLTTFGTSSTQKSSFLGKFSLQRLERVVWHPAGVDQTTTGEQEPLLEGLMATSAGLRSESADSSVLVVMSGADVALTSNSGQPGKLLTLQNLELKPSKETYAIFAQITPEPSEDLRNASLRLRDVARVRYVEYSEVVAEDVISELRKTAEDLKIASINPQAFGPYAKIAHAKRMMAVLPRVLTPNSTPPARQAYADRSNWYTIRLWLTFDELIWSEASLPAPRDPEQPFRSIPSSR